MILPIDTIVIPERIREEFDAEELKRLSVSLRSIGQLQPILISPDGVLTAGERRIRAVRILFESGHTVQGLPVGHIWAEYMSSDDPRVTLQREFDENNQRADFTFVEKAKFIRRYHETMIAEVGDAWEAQHTAVALRLSQASISHYLRVEDAMRSDPTVAKAATLQAAVKRMKTAEKHTVRKLEVKDNAPEAAKRAEGIILLGDARELIKAVADNSVDLINFDPPWGDDTGRKSNQNWDGFEDDTESSDSIINDMLPELFRVLKPDRMMIYWYRSWAQQEMMERLTKAGFNLKFTRTPCIWYKPDKVSDQNRFPEKQLIASYETFFLARKGEPLLHEQGRQDTFAFDRVPVAALIHPTEKPVALCQELLRLTTIPGELVLDPTAGSGSFLYGALITSRRAMGFEMSETIRDRSLVRIAEWLRNVK